MSTGGGEAHRGGLRVWAVLHRCPSNDNATAKTSGGGGCRLEIELEGKERIGGDGEDNEEVGRLRFALFA